MIDLHSHILPGIDDGARTLEDSVALAKQSLDVGVTKMVCTPHIHHGTFDNDISTITTAYNLLLNRLKEESISLQLAYSAEVRLSTELVAMIVQNKLPFLGQYKGKKAILLELPHSHIPAGTDTLIKWLLSQNIQPVIPHPERNREILDNYNKAIWLKKIGCIFQLTAGALTGRFKARVYDTAWQMLDDKLIAYIASDLHSVNRRPNDMGDAYAAIEKQYNSGIADDLCLNVPAHIRQDLKWENA